MLLGVPLIGEHLAGEPREYDPSRGFEHGKQGEPHQVDDAYIETVTPELLAMFKATGWVVFPWFTCQMFSDEGYPEQHEYEEEK